MVMILCCGNEYPEKQKQHQAIALICQTFIFITLFLTQGLWVTHIKCKMHGIFTITINFLWK